MKYIVASYCFLSINLDKFEAHNNSTLMGKMPNYRLQKYI